MRAFNKTVTLTVTATGAGTKWGSTDFFPPGASGRVDTITVRRDASDDVGTQADLYVATNQDELSAVPADDDVVIEALTVTLTQSATQASLDSGLDYPPHFQDGLRIGGVFTVAGAGNSVTHWTLTGEIGD